MTRETTARTAIGACVAAFAIAGALMLSSPRASFPAVPPTDRVVVLVEERGVPPESDDVGKSHATECKAYAPLRELVEELADAFAERAGQPHAEPAPMRAARLDAFTLEVLEATRPLGSPRAWRYAVTLVFLAHRETRIARSPRLLGSEDDGRAAGPWSIWPSVHAGDAFRAKTALRVLLEHPGAWSLPDGAPWLGYGACSRWLARHPEP
jgi:hypothetical protein